MANQADLRDFEDRFRIKFRNQPENIQQAILEGARLERLAEAERRGRPREYANANIASLAALRATSKDPFSKFAKKEVPENVEKKIKEYLGVLPYNLRINNTQTRRVRPTSENVIRGILATPATQARRNRATREKAAALARKHEAAMNAYMTAKLTEEERTREERARAKQKSRERRRKSLNLRQMRGKTGSREAARYTNRKTNKAKAGDKKKRNLTHRQRIIEKYIKQSINNNENN